MTREVFTPSPSYPINGTGPYGITHPYQSDALTVVIDDGSSLVVLDPVDYTVDPIASETQGTLTLTAGAADLHAEGTLYIRRNTSKEQGWKGQTSREDGLEGQLDSLTMAIQDQEAEMDRAVRLVAPDGSGNLMRLVSGRALLAAEPGSGAAVVPGPTADEIVFAQEHAVSAEASAATAAEKAAEATEATALAQIGYTYASRQEAEDATVIAVAQRIGVKSPSGLIVDFARADPSEPHPALLTNDGTVKWIPVGPVSPQHYAENTVPGTTDLAAAFASMLAYLNGGDTTEEQSVRNNATRTITGHGEHIGIGSTVMAGLMDADQNGTAELGCGPLHNLVFKDMTLESLAGTWPDIGEAGDTDTLKPLIFVGDYRNTGFTSNNEFMVGRIEFDFSVIINCNFISDGIFFENTQKCAFNGRVINVRKNGYGVKTSEQNWLNNHRGFGTKNIEFSMRFNRLDGEDRMDGAGDYPPGEDITTMNNVGIHLGSNDVQIWGTIVTNCTTAMSITAKGVYLFGVHPWSRKITLSDTTDKVYFYNTYFDFTDLDIIRPSNSDIQRISFVGCNWQEGDCDLNIIATKAGEDGEGIVLSGCGFYGTGTINYQTSGAGTWLSERDRKIVLGNTYSETAASPFMQVGDKFILYPSGAFQTELGLALDADGSIEIGQGKGGSGQTIASMAWSGSDFIISPSDGAAKDTFNDFRYVVDNNRYQKGFAFHDQSFMMKFDTLADFKTWNTARIAASQAPPTGDVILAEGVLYEFEAGNTSVTGLNDWKEVGDIRPTLGTVSQTAGEPTGAIIQRGSNANGEFVRYADGTQVCTHTKTIAFAAGSYLSSVWGFPIAFAAGSKLFVLATPIATAVPTVAGRERGDMVPYSSNTSNALSIIQLWRGSGTTDFVSGNTADLDVTAVGRWF